MGKLISVIFPTRKRIQLLEKSIQSIISSTDDFSKVEILIGVDDDDIETQEYLKTKSYPIEMIFKVYPRYSYRHLNIYVNELSKISTGELLMLWNDDAVIVTPHWDTIIENVYRNEKKPIAVYQVPNNHHLTIFPIISRSIYENWGFFSDQTHTDSFIEWICWGFYKTIPVTVYHERADPSKAGNYAEANESSKISSPEFHSAQNKEKMKIHREKFFQLLRDNDLPVPTVFAF